jgi:predicted RNA-binding protein with PIN domain
VRVVSGGRVARRRPPGNGELTPALDKLLRQAIEAAVAVARAGEEDTPAVPAPPALRPFLQFAKLPPRAIVVAQRAVDGDEEFRSRVAESVSEDDVGRAGWLWLTRPEGWDADLESLAHGLAEAGEAQAERRAENDARRRLAGAEAATQRAEAAAAAAQAESARAAAALAEERRARRVAAQEAEDLARRLEQAASERDRARADRDRAREEATRAQQRASDAKQALEELRRTPPAPPPAPESEAVVAPAPAGLLQAEEVRRAAGALLQAADAAAGMAASLRQAAEALGAAPPSPQPPPVVPAPPRRARPPRRVPAALPPGVLDDSVEAADHLVRVPGIAVLVDGYNASHLGWYEFPIAEQRRRLVDALTELATRTGADISVVLDGAEPVGPPVVPTTARRVRVSFSPPGVEADDVVLARVAEIDVSRPVLVASSDRRVQDGAAALGANVISSAQLLGALRR